MNTFKIFIKERKLELNADKAKVVVKVEERKIGNGVMRYWRK